MTMNEILTLFENAGVKDNTAPILSIAMELNIRSQMEYFTRMFSVQAMTRDEYIDEMSSLAVILEDLASDAFGYKEKGDEK